MPINDTSKTAAVLLASPQDSSQTSRARADQPEYVPQGLWDLFDLEAKVKHFNVGAILAALGNRTFVYPARLRKARHRHLVPRVTAVAEILISAKSQSASSRNLGVLSLFQEPVYQT